MWIPAFAGMTNHFAGMTNHFAGMTNHFAGMTNHFAGTTNHFAGTTNHFAGMTNHFSSGSVGAAGGRLRMTGGCTASLRKSDGFTLVEVLIALLVLSIGLLGLEALGIGAARSLAFAKRQSGSATVAADSLESAMHQLRKGTLPAQFCRSDLAFGDRLSRVVDLTNPRLPAVTVLTLPSGTTVMAPTDTFSISSSLYIPPDSPTIVGVTGAPCS